MAAPTYVASASTTFASGTSQSLTIPSGAAVGDLMIVAVGVNGNASNDTTMPAGWTRKYQTTLSGWGDTYAMLSIFYKRVASGEPGTSVTITLGVSNRGSANMQVYNGAVATGDPFDAFGTVEGTSSSDPATVTFTTTVETTLYTAITIDSTSVTLTTPTSFTRRYTTPSGSDRSDSADWVSQAAGSKTVTWTRSANNRSCVFGGGIKGASGLGATLVIATETDAVVAVGKRKTKTLVVDTETDAAQVLGRRKVKALATVTETDTAIVIERATPALGVALETDTTVTIGRTKIKALATVTETDATVTITPQHRRTLTPATETDTTLVFGKRKSKLLAVTLETDTALNLQATPINPANETDTAVAIGRRKRKTVPLVTETDATVVITRRKRKTLTPVTETDAVVVLGRRKRKAIATVTELDTAGVVSEPVFTFTPPTYEKPYTHPWPTGVGSNGIYKGARFHLDQAVSIVRKNGVLRAVRSPAPEQLAAAGVEGQDWFIGGHIYTISAGTMAELQAGGFA